MKNIKTKILYIAILTAFSAHLTNAAPVLGSNVHEDQEKSAYQGSEANKKSINFLSESVNPATRAFSVSLPFVSLQGYLSQSVNISFNAYSQNGMLGLPDGWQYNIDYIVRGDGNQFLCF